MPLYVAWSVRMPHRWGITDSGPDALKRKEKERDHLFLTV